MSKKKRIIIKLLRKGVKYKDIAYVAKCSFSTISYHAKRIGLERIKFTKHDWKEIQHFYDKGYSMRKCTPFTSFI